MQALVSTYLRPQSSCRVKCAGNRIEGNVITLFAGTYTCAAHVMKLTQKFNAPDAAAGTTVATPLHENLNREAQTIKSGSPTHQGD